VFVHTWIIAKTANMQLTEGLIKIDLQAWKDVANSWRTIEETVEKLSIVQKVTQEALKEVDDSPNSAFDFLNAPLNEDEESDIP